ncbi:MAG: type I-C CRISPR-associated protein Cas5c [Planctomycetes bacterium]|nr:type I-C CRISPR-associated protein Cas5c [Planctomycetota bacterium]
MISDPIRIRVWGPYACFTRPEFHVERVSYPIITPSAARGILEAILMKPVEKPEAHKRRDKEGFRWHVLRMGIVHEGTMVPVLRNELGYEKHTFAGYDIMEERTQRHSLILRDVEYVIEAAIETSEGNMGKYCGCVERRTKKGQCHHRPYLGCREFPCDFEWAPGAVPNESINKSYGFIFRDFDFEAVWDHWPDEQRPNVWRDKTGRTISPQPLPALNAVAVNGWIKVRETPREDRGKDVKPQ